MIVGIDLGTTNSLVAVLRGGEPETLPNELGEHLTPSAIAVAEDGTLLVGRAAKDRLVLAPKAGRAFFKRDMGTDKRYVFGGRKWSPVECSAAILKELRRVAEFHLGEEVNEAVVSVPAYFHDTQRQATVSAAEIAGLRVARVINEPTAAALAFGYKNPKAESHLLVFDLGGGTFDVTILEAFEGVVEVLASCGDSALGGEDYTDALLERVASRAGWSLDGSARARARQVIEVAKRGLARAMTHTVRFGDTDPVEVTRDDLEAAGRAFTARLRPILTRALRDAEIDPGKLDDCLLVGGATRMHLVQESLQQAIGRRGSHAVDPDRAVAFGAAVQAAACERHEAVRDLILTDVCPHTLGTEVVKEFGPGNYEEGYFNPIIDRNVTVPVSRSIPLQTLHPQQNVIEVGIYQGESRFAKDNTYLGGLKVKGLRHRAGQKRPGQIEVRFSYDMNAILEVEVTVLETGERITKVIESRPGTLTENEIAAAIRRLQPLKTRQRDLLPNRARVERANRLYTELSGTAREALSSLVDQFEAALETEDGEQVAVMGLLLDDMLRPYFEDEGEIRSDEGT